MEVIESGTCFGWFNALADGNYLILSEVLVIADDISLEVPTHSPVSARAVFS